MQFPYEYSYFAFDFCLIKKNVCEKAKESERGSEGTGEGGREGGKSERGLAEISSLTDERE